MCWKQVIQEEIGVFGRGLVIMGTSWSQDEDLQHKQTQTQTQEKVIKPLQVNDANGEVCTNTAHQVKMPNRYEEILKYADTEMDKSSSQKLLDQLYHGVFLNQKKKKYWVDRHSNNCFMLFASDLLITWAEDTNHWHWLSIKESSDEPVLVAVLLNVCWLEVHVRFNTNNLTPKTLYEVVFIVMMKDPAYGWEIPVNLRLKLADGTRQEHKESLMEKPRGIWTEIPVGEFKALPENMGDAEISLYEYEGGVWKRGLIIKGVIIQPKV